MTRLAPLLLAPALLLLPACATYDPDVVCTADWIGTRADRAVGEIERDTAGVIRSFRRVAEDYADGDRPGPLALLSLTRSVDRLKRELTDGRGIRDLRVLGKTCDDPLIVARGLDTWLDRQGLGPNITSLIRDTGLLETLADLSRDLDDEPV